LAAYWRQALLPGLSLRTEALKKKKRDNGLPHGDWARTGERFRDVRRARA